MKSVELIKYYEKLLGNKVVCKEDLHTLLALQCGCDKHKIFLNFDLTKKEERGFAKLIKRRIKGEPMQKIIGYTEFLGLKIPFCKYTLTPRQATEILVEKVIEDINKISGELSVLDMCAGSGCIGLAIQKHTKSKVLLADISPKAISHIKKTAKENNLSFNVTKSNMFQKIKESFDIIVSNPPYLKECELQRLDGEVKNFDPKLALDGGKDGLKFYRIIANNLQYLKVNGNLYLEIHYELANETKLIFEKYFENVSIVKDYSGIDRFLICENKKEFL